jgi:serine/threonine-protein kinase RIO1
MDLMSNRIPLHYVFRLVVGNLSALNILCKITFFYILDFSSNRVYG